MTDEINNGGTNGSGDSERSPWWRRPEWWKAAAAWATVVATFASPFITAAVMKG